MFRSTPTRTHAVGDCAPRWKVRCALAGSAVSTCSYASDAQGASVWGWYIALLATGCVALLWMIGRRKQLAEKYFHRALWVGLSLCALCFIAGVASFAITHQQWHTGTLHHAEQDLQRAVRQAQQDTHRWLDEQQRDLAALALQPRVQNPVRTLLDVSDSPALRYRDEIETLSSFLAARQEIDATGISVIAPDGKTVFSQHDSDIGRTHLIAEQRVQGFAAALRGEKVFIPPLPARRLIPGTAEIAGFDVSATMWLLAPIIGEDGTPFAVIATELLPTHTFSRLLSRQAPDEQADVYAVNADGFMLSESRHRDALYDARLLQPGQSSVLSMRLQAVGETALLTPPMHALRAGETGSEALPYGDHRGQSVLGAWRWDSALEMGFIAEWPVAEVLAAGQPLLNAAWLLLALFLLVICMGGALYCLLRAHHQLALHKALDGQARSHEDQLADVRRRQALLENLCDQLPVPVYLRDENGQLLVCNPAARSQLAMTAGRRQEPALQVLEKQDAEVLEYGISKEGELDLTSPTGSVYAYWYSKQLVELNEGLAEHADGQVRPRAVLHYAHDITRYRLDALQHSERAQAELKDLQYLKNLFDAANYMMFATDANGVIRVFNRTAEQVLQYRAAALIGNKTPLAFHDEMEIAVRRHLLQQELNQRLDNDFDVLVAKARQGLNDEQEWTFVRRDGERIPVVLSMSVVRDSADEISGYLGIAGDIAERKHIQQALVEAKEEAEVANLAKSEFLASMSHEIRTPMNGVMGMLGLVLQSELATEQRNKLQVAQNSARALLNIINDILDFSKVEAGKLELDQVPFSIRHVFDDAIKSFALMAEQKKLGLHIDMLGVHEDRVEGDPGRLRQIVSNLLANALKFTPEGDIVVRLSTRFYDDRHCQLQCSVQDTGIGIPLDRHEHLFDSFTQVDASTTRRYGGTGLGLSICKKLVELMGGRISVESSPGQGSCFRFNVLLDRAEGQIEPVNALDLSQAHVLIVDDHAINRDILREQLTLWGAHVTEAESAAEARKISAQSQAGAFTLAILDQHMPDEDGLTLARALKARAEWQATPLMMMSSMSAHIDKAALRSAGLSACLMKPVSNLDLYDAIAQLLGSGLSAGQLINENSLLGKASLQSAQRATENHWPQHARVLLVEDNQVNQMVGQGMIAALGLPCDVAGNGIEALESLNQSPEDAPYSLILMDCNMPDLDGYQATRAIRRGEAGERYVGVPVIALTAHAMQGDREKCLAAGMNDYIAKPVEAPALLAMCNTWLGERTEAGDRDVEAASDAYLSTAENRDKSASAEAAPPVWQLPQALERLSGNERLLHTVVDLFLQDTPRRLQAMEERIAQQDLASIVAQAHALKGASATIAAEAMRHHALAMEQAARANDSEALPLHLAALAVCFDETVAYIRQHLPAKDALANSAQANVSELCDLLDSLQQRLQAGDFIDPDEIEQLHAPGYDAALRPMLRKLARQLLSLEIEAATASIQAIRNVLSAQGR